MGIGGSTGSRPGSETVLVVSERPASGQEERSRSSQDERPTGSCCSHFRRNHASATRTVTPAVQDSIDEDIEEIVANTVDCLSNQSLQVDATADSARVDLRGSGARTFTPRSKSSGVQKRPSDEIEDDPSDAKSTLPEVDFAKFKKVNHKGSTISSNGRVIHHQESDLLWRLGLISPEAYKLNPSPRSAPSNQGPYLKTPSYDLTEEQLMANIEKEFEVTI